MPEHRCTTEVAAPPEVLWEFVKDMGNWAPFLTGYQQHETIDASDSIWTLKGDVGILQRVVKLRAHITEWNGPSRVAFTLTGLNENVEGGGTVTIEASDAPAPAASRPAAGGWFARLLAALFRWLHALQFGKTERALPTAGRGGSRLTFELRMEAGGPTGPLVNAMLGPAMAPATEDLAQKIAAHVERGHAANR
jgi:carbon monoxide dehydrogenase subunit G